MEGQGNARRIMILSGAGRNAAPQATSDDDDTRLALCLARLAETDPELAKVIAAWPTLPPPIRRAIRALID